jgi:3-oxoacyl-[acyl-carrier protein] reductase
MKFEKLLIASKGSVVNIGSVACFNAVRGNPAYSASKGGLLTLTKSLAQLWARHGVRVNGVAPGFVRTKLTEAQHANREMYEASLRAIPLGRWGEPEEIGGAVLFLASPLASYITGQMILVDGGVTLS